jgi:hypothetical protein
MSTSFKYAFKTHGELFIYEVEYLNKDPKDLNERFKWQTYNTKTHEHIFLQFDKRNNTTRFFKDGSIINIVPDTNAEFFDATTRTLYVCIECPQDIKKTLPV